MTLHFLGIGISGDCFANTPARFWVIFVSMGNDSFRPFISSSVFQGSSIMAIPCAGALGGRQVLSRERRHPPRKRGSRPSREVAASLDSRLRGNDENGHISHRVRRTFGLRRRKVGAEAGLAPGLDLG